MSSNSVLSFRNLLRRFLKSLKSSGNEYSSSILFSNLKSFQAFEGSIPVYDTLMRRFDIFSAA